MLHEMMILILCLTPTTFHPILTNRCTEFMRLSMTFHLTATIRWTPTILHHISAILRQLPMGFRSI